MPCLTDQMHRVLEIPPSPRRIISLVPSQTELLFDLGLEREVVGVTKFCVHPREWRKRKNIIGGTKHFHLDRIRSLKPDLIIGNKEENYREGIEELDKEFPVWMSDINTLADALQMIEQLSEITGFAEQGKRIIEEIEGGFNQLQPLNSPISCLYLIWRNPFMGVGGNTFIDDMLGGCGFNNMLAVHGRYPELPEGEIKRLNPRLVLLSSEPYPFKEKHIHEIKKLCPEAEVLLVDGEMFSWYGSRLCQSFSYFQSLLQELRLRFKI